MKAEGIAVYPNPFSDIITVSGLKDRDNLALVDLTGRTIYNWTSSSETQTFAIGDLAAGIYLLKIMNEDGMIRVNVPVVKR